MGVQPPFLYDPPSRYSFSGPTEKSFNPKAATQASWTPSYPKPKPNGPLINLNRHPDSYIKVPYGNLDARPMDPNTKSRVKYSRLAQLILRILALIGTLGILFCVIVIKETSASVGWIIRVAPSIALLHTVYAIYHLCQAPTGRTPGSSASYMIFAALIDAGLIPFLVFTAFMAYTDYTTAAYAWETLFGDPQTTRSIICATFILCVVEGSLLLLSFAIDIYLTLVFRKISKLPPDMNPLEPNLTARPHKRNKSEFVKSEKYMSQTSLVSSNRTLSQADPLVPSSRRVPFMHTRTDSAEDVSLYQNNNARYSHMDVSKPASFYEPSNHSRCGSYAPLDKSFSSQPCRPRSAAAPSFTSRITGEGGLEHRPARSSNLATDRPLRVGDDIRPVSPVSFDHQQFKSAYSSSEPVNDENAPPPVSPTSSRASTPDHDRHGEYMEIKDWYSSPHAKRRMSQDLSPIQPPQYSPNRPSFSGQERRGSLYDFDRDLRSPSPVQQGQETSGDGRDGRNPLGMNPPPPLQPHHHQEQGHGEQDERSWSHHPAEDPGAEGQEPKRYALHDAPVNLPPISQRSKVSSRPLSFVESGSKERYYGDLRSPVGSIITAAAKNKANYNDNSGKNEMASDTASDYSNYRTETMDSHIEIFPDEQDDYLKMVANVATSDYDNDSGQRHRRQQNGDDLVPVHIDADSDDYDGRRRRRSDGDVDASASASTDHDSDRTGRVVSNTAHDLSSGYAGLGAEFGRGMGRRRDVSGKLVEEGRMGYAASTSASASSPASGPASDPASRSGSGFGSSGTPSGMTTYGQGLSGGRGTGGILGAAGWARFKGL